MTGFGPEEGQWVYLIDDPGQRGRLTGRSRLRSDGTVCQIAWNNSHSSWEPEYAFEKVTNELEDDVFSLLKKKQFGRLNDLRRHLTFIQLSGKLADMLYGMDTTNTDFYAYQYKPVLSFLESPSNGILIADEVGLGKTIEAGLIWTELRARYYARRLVVVCPAMLREKWCSELRKKFGVDAIQLSAGELLRELKLHKHQIPEGKGYVCSIQGLRPLTGWRKLENRDPKSKLARELEDMAKNEPVIDLLVIDEAHYLRNPETQSFVLGRLLREVSEHVVLLSATPVNNKEKDLFTLLRLLDPETFSNEAVFPQVLAANEPLIRARNLALDREVNGAKIKQELKIAAGIDTLLQQTSNLYPLLKENKQLRGLLKRDFSDQYLAEVANRIELANRIERVNLLSHVVNRTRKVEVQELKVVRAPSSHFLTLDKKGPEWDFYERVTASIRDYAQNRGISDGFLLATPQRQMSSCMYAAAESWKDRSWEEDLEALLYDDLGADDIETTKSSPLIDYIANDVLPYVDIRSLRDTDTKYNKFSQVVSEYLREHPSEKIIVFSYFKATLSYLSERLNSEGLSNQLLHGGIGETKQDVIDKFREDSELRILLSSEIASEGVDLQFSRVLINYDLPWNPMKIEQRIGRIDRIGQKEDRISIINLGYSDTIDERIYTLLLEKLKIFERALGGMEAILGDKINELTSELLSKSLTPEEEKQRINAKRVAIENIRKQQEELEQKAHHLIAHGGYILERVKEAHEFSHRITERDIKLYVKDYLDRYCEGFSFVESDDDPTKVKIRLSAKTSALFDEYILQNRLHGQSRLAGGDTVNCRFENKVGTLPRKQDEFISQFHPFIRFISKELTEKKEFFYPLLAVQLDHDKLLSKNFISGTYAFVVNIWAFNGLREEKYLRARAMLLSSNELLDSNQSLELVNAARLEGEDWLSAARDIDIKGTEQAFDECDSRLLGDYEVTRDDHKNENADRITFQVQSAEQHKNRLLTIQQQLLQRYRLDNNQRLIPPTQGRIRAIENKFNVQIEKFKLKEKMTSHPHNIAYGVILVK